MIHIYSEQLTYQLNNKLKSSYLIFGKHFFLLQESIDEICKFAQHKGFFECYTYSLEINTNWNVIYHVCKSFSLFSSRKILILILPKNGFTTIIESNLFKLVNLLHSDLIFILCGTKLTKIQENSMWYQIISKDGVYVNCLIPELFKLPEWISKRAKNMSINLDREANELLCYYYEGNLIALNQILKNLIIIYPNSNITIKHIKEVINYNTIFTPYHWVDALLIGKMKRVWYILEQLKYKNYEPLILLRIIQRELILLLTLLQENDYKNFRKIFNQYKILFFRHESIMFAIKHLSIYQVEIAIQLIADTELHFKQDYNYLIWLKLETLCILLCNKSLPIFFINNLIN